MLELGVLGLLCERPQHGYELKKRLVSLLGPWTSLSFGSLYPALTRLDKAGYVVGIADQRPMVAPMSGSLRAELAAFARQSATSPSPGRSKKVFQITPAGRQRLAELALLPAPDDRYFELCVAFCDQLNSEQRARLFETRSRQLQQQLDQLQSCEPSSGYRASLGTFRRDRLSHDLAWVTQLLNDEHSVSSPTSANSNGGS